MVLVIWNLVFSNIKSFDSESELVQFVIVCCRLVIPLIHLWMSFSNVQETKELLQLN